jgi:apolipoprotein N-acyltransferase
MLVRRATGRTEWALAAAPFLWTALDLLAARFTSVPWDQLGYSQVDNRMVNLLAPWTGVYGITFLLVAANAFFACVNLGVFRVGWRKGESIGWRICITIAILFLWSVGIIRPSRGATTSATAVLVQPNLDVGDENN